MDIKKIIKEAHIPNYAQPSLEDTSYVLLNLALGVIKRSVYELVLFNTFSSEVEQALINKGVKMINGDLSIDSYIKELEKTLKKESNKEFKFDDALVSQVTMRLQPTIDQTTKKLDLTKETSKSVKKDGTLKEAKDLNFNQWVVGTSRGFSDIESKSTVSENEMLEIIRETLDEYDFGLYTFSNKAFLVEGEEFSIVFSTSMLPKHTVLSYVEIPDQGTFISFEELKEILVKSLKESYGIVNNKQEDLERSLTPPTEADKKALSEDNTTESRIDPRFLALPEKDRVIVLKAIGELRLPFDGVVTKQIIDKVVEGFKKHYNKQSPQMKYFIDTILTTLDPNDFKKFTAKGKEVFLNSELRESKITLEDLQALEKFARDYDLNINKVKKEWKFSKDNYKNVHEYIKQVESNRDFEFLEGVIEEANVLEPQSKDYMRITDLVRKGEILDTKGRFLKGVGARQLAQTMANKITDVSKAYRRYKAAEEENFHDLALIFYKRYRDLEKHSVNESVIEETLEYTVGKNSPVHYNSEEKTFVAFSSDLDLSPRYWNSLVKVPQEKEIVLTNNKTGKSYTFVYKNWEPMDGDKNEVGSWNYDTALKDGTIVKLIIFND